MDCNEFFPGMLKGEAARLIPVLPDSRKEEKATSVLLATFSVVPGFARAMLEEVQAPRAKRLQVHCFTEVTFKLKNGDESARPDGLLVVSYGKRHWSALIESKIGNAELDKEQIEAYLDLAREIGSDAVITISNQFAALPTHHPVKVSKQKLRTVDLYHFSWLSLISKAILLAEGSEITDPEQAFILRELIRYLNHKSSGAITQIQMCRDWKDAYLSVQQETKLTKSSDTVISTVSSWHELTRYIALHLGLDVNRNVQVHIKRNHTKSPEERLKADIQNFIDNNKLSAEFVIPNAAAHLKLIANFSLRTITLSMRLNAPKDLKRATACINWLTRQLARSEDETLLIVAQWPGRINDTKERLGLVIEDPKCLLGVDNMTLPTAFEVTKVVDLGARFKGAKTFVEDTLKAVPDFYGDAGQLLKAWVPAPPKIRKIEPDAEECAGLGSERPES